MKNIVIFLFLIFLTDYLVLPVALAEEDEYSPQDKFSRGIFNMITFVFEVPITVYKTSVEKNPVIGIIYGIPLGVGKAIIKLAVGAAEFTTFPFPPYKPMPEFR